MSQDELAKKIGLSRVAISDLENGKRSISALELSSICRVFGIHIDYFLKNEGPVNPSRTLNKEDIHFDPEKLKNALLYVLELCGGKPNIGETVLYKLLYFIDFNFFEITGKPVTGLTYVKLQYGPVPSARQYLPIIESMVSLGELKIMNQNYYGKQQKKYISLMNSNIDIFTSKELKVIGKVVEQLSDMSASQIEEYVHEDAPWKISGMKEAIPYLLCRERKPPFAQLDYDQLWQDAGAIDTLRELGEMSDEESEYYKNLKS